VVHWETYPLVLGLSSFKFLFGVAAAIGNQYHFWEQFLVTFVGGAAGTTLLTFFGERLRAWWFRVRYRSSKGPHRDPNRALPKWQRAIKRSGLLGIALLTPPLLSPPLGCSLAVALGYSRLRITVAMAASMLIWAFVFSLAGQGIFMLLVKWGFYNQMPASG